jgi:ketosteroid isomerase-like protein
MKLLTLFVLALLPVSLLAADATAPSREEKEVMQVTQDACDAFLKADVAAAEALFAPDFTLVSSRAVVQSRDAVLAEIRKGETVYSEFRNHSMNAHVYGDAAIVQGITSLKGSSGGQAFELDVRFTDTLIRSHGKWRLVVSHVTRIPD